MRIFSLLLVVILAFNTSCAKQEDSSKDSVSQEKKESSQKHSSKPKYTSKADLAGIKKQGKLRLIAPRFDGAEALPRNGVPILNYHAIAEELAAEMGVEAYWVYVDGFDDLLPTLKGGKGDIIVTNLSITDERQKSVSFTNSIARVKEVVVGKKSISLKSLEDIQALTLSVPKGTAYVETIKNYKEGELKFEEIETSISDSDLLAGIATGQYDATVLDSDIVNALLPAYPDLKKGKALNKKRLIAWAVRKENPVLLKFVNEYLVSHHVKASANKNEKRDWAGIKEKGRLRMLTLNNPASYFMYRGELMGFDYELVKKFADDNDLHLSVILKENIPDLFDALKKGEGDVIAASITKTSEREKQGLVFSRPYLKVKEQLVGREGGPSVATVDELDGHTLGINPDTVFIQRLKEKMKSTTKIKVKQYRNTQTEELISLLEHKEFDFTVADSHLVAIEKAYHKEINVNLDLTDESPIAWVLRPDQEELTSQLNAYIKKHYRGLFYNVTFNKHFKNDRKIQKFQKGRVTSETGLSPYDSIVKPIAESNGMDWRLIVAQMYQESKFNPKAKSFAGAQGLMQVLPRTAKELGYTKLFQPDIGIKAGIGYLKWLQDRFPQNLDVDQRIYFTLAAYNAGTGHVRDAMQLAKQLGHNPHIWFGNVELAMLKLSDPKYYKKARFGYVRGAEPVEYVKSIRDRYLGYLSAGAN